MILHWNCPSHTQIVHVVPPHKNRKLHFHVKYVYKYIYFRHQRSTNPQPSWFAGSVVRGVQRGNWLELLEGKGFMLILSEPWSVFFMANLWRILPETNSVQAPETLGVGSGRVFVGLRKVDGGNSMWLRWFNGWTWGWAGFVSFLCFLLLGHVSYVDCLMTFLHLNNLLILLEQWCVHVFWSHSWV